MLLRVLAPAGRPRDVNAKTRVQRLVNAKTRD